MTTELSEGWGGLVGRKAHYYRESFSLCGRPAFYSLPLAPETSPSQDDCIHCRGKLDRERRRNRP